MPQCSARSKRTGEQCKAPAMQGKSVCHIHGGKSPGGIASPSLVTGRYSKYLPLRLHERYAEALADGHLIALREEISLLDSRLADVLSRVDTGESGEMWKTVQGLMRDVDKAKDEDRQDALADLRFAITAGCQDWAAWEEVRSLIEQRRKLAETERKRLVDEQQMIQVDQAVLLIGRVAAIIRQHVTDPLTLATIADELRKLVNRQSGG